jgi:hypothetical protein
VAEFWEPFFPPITLPAKFKELLDDLWLRRAA